jgi:hypothetical protein
MKTHKPKQSVKVEQVQNPKFDDGKPEHGSANPKLLFRVELAVNILQVRIGQYLTPNEVDRLIHDAVTVTISL